MAIFARSDLCYVAVSTDHGGCGSAHSRPVIGGAPVKVWALDCPGGCEDYLRKDSLWAATATTIPETPDETATREDVEKRGQVEQANATAAALRDLAKLGDLPSAIAKLAQFMAGSAPQIEAQPVPLLLCQHGHQNRATASFCSSCGTSLSEPVKADRGRELTEAGPKTSGDLESLSLSELRGVAKKVGARTARSREDQISAIREASDNS